jgi:hypothetical protein
MTSKGLLVAIGGRRRIALPLFVSLATLSTASATSSGMLLPRVVRPKPDPIVNGFVEAQDLLGAGTAYWNHNALGDTYVLSDGRLLHALPAGTIRDRGVVKRRIWVVAERNAPGATKLIPRSPRPTALAYLQRTRSSARELHSYGSVDLPESVAQPSRAIIAVRATAVLKPNPRTPESYTSRSHWLRPARQSCRHVRAVHQPPTAKMTANKAKNLQRVMTTCLKTDQVPFMPLSISSSATIVAAATRARTETACDDRIKRSIARR